MHETMSIAATPSRFRKKTNWAEIGGITMPKKSKTRKNIGFLHSGTKKLNQDLHDEFFKSLKSAGYKANITEYWAEDDLNKLDPYANALATADPRLDLIVAAGGSASAIAATKATNATDPNTPIPVVFTTYFELNKPGANSTGVCARTSELDLTRLYKLRQMFPGVQQVGALVNSKRLKYKDQKAALDKLAAKLKIHLDAVDINPTLGDPATLIDQAFQHWRQIGITAAIVTADPIFQNYCQEVIKSATKKPVIPAIYQWHDFIRKGAKGISYGTYLADAYHLAGTIAGKVLKAGDADGIDVVPLPNIGLLIDPTTAKQIGRKIPGAKVAGPRKKRRK